MTESSSQIRTGIFVAFGIAVLIASILFFGGDKAFLTKYRKYYVKFDSTQGLGSGSVISLAGMEVGHVKDIVFDSDMKLIAEIEVDSQFSDRVTNDSVASIRTQGALGDKYVYITVAPSGTPLKEGDTITTDHQPDLIDIISGKATDLGVALDAIKELNQFLHNLNADGRTVQLLESISGAGKSLGLVMGDPAVRESFQHLKNILKKIDGGQGTLGELVNNSELHDRLLGLLGETPRNRFLKPLLREAIKQNEHPR